MSDQNEKDDQNPKPSAPTDQEDGSSGSSQNLKVSQPQQDGNASGSGGGGGGQSNNVTTTPTPQGIPSSSATPSTSLSFKKGRRGEANNQNQDLVPQTSRKFAPLIHHRRPVRAYLSAEETMFHSKNPADPPKQKSASNDTLRSEDVVEGLPESTPGSEANNNANANFKSFFFKGRPFRNVKVTPSTSNSCVCAVTVLTPTPVTQEVLTLSPALILTESEHNQGHGQGQSSGLGSPTGHWPCSKRSSKAGETCVNMSASTDSLENICRICHDSPSSEKLIKPCLCKGSMGQVHRSCLEHWLGESGKGSCEICGQEFNTVRVPKYKGIRSLIAWIRHPMNPTDSRNFFFDLACFFILTPLAILSGWLCIVGARSYSSEEAHKSFIQPIHTRHLRHETLTMRANRDISNSTWTSIGLLSLTGTLVAAYLIWIFVALRYHIQVWREWQQRNYIVTIVPLENGEFCFPPAPPPPPEEQRVHFQAASIQDLNMNANNPEQGGSGGGGGGNRDEGRNVGSDSNLLTGKDSPTTRFIQELFIPSMANWEASNNVNNANVNVSNLSEDVHVDGSSRAHLGTPTATPSQVEIAGACGVHIDEEMQLQILLEEHHSRLRDLSRAKRDEDREVEVDNSAK